MKKERKLKLIMNKMSISKLNNLKVKGGGDDTSTVPSITYPCAISVDTASCVVDTCRTGLTVFNQTVGAC